MSNVLTLEYPLESYNSDQLRVLVDALVDGVDITHLDPEKWAADQMIEEAMAQRRGFSISDLDPGRKGWYTMSKERVKREKIRRI